MIFNFSHIFNVYKPVILISRIYDIWVKQNLDYMYTSPCFRVWMFVIALKPPFEKYKK